MKLDLKTLILRCPKTDKISYESISDIPLMLLKSRKPYVCKECGYIHLTHSDKPERYPKHRGPARLWIFD